MKDKMIVIRGGGDLASGAALRLHRAGFQVVILELPKPLAVRRTVSFAEAAYEETQTIEGVTARLVSADQIMVTLEADEIPILIDPNANILRNQFVTSPQSTIVIDARLLKTPSEALDVKVTLMIGLGPGFNVGENCDAVIETRRGHTLGRVYWSGSAQPDSGEPDGDRRRVLRASSAGVLTSNINIGDAVEESQPIANIQVDEETVLPVISPFKGILRGMIRSGSEVTKGMKIGDVDRRSDPAMVKLVSDKALAVGGGALEAVMIFLKGKDN